MTLPTSARILLLASFVLAGAAVAHAAAPGGFDPVAATEAYVQRLTPEAIAKSDAYFEGGYWLQLWNFLLAAVIGLAILATGLSNRMRRFSEGLTRFGWVQTLIFGAQYLALTAVLTFPMNLYQGFFREHQYGLSNQDFFAWLRDESIGLVINAVVGGFAVVVLYAVLKRVTRAWWVWASAGPGCAEYWKPSARARHAVDPSAACAPQAKP